MDIGIPITNRKIRKPLMEKRRRARINQSVEQLQKLISENNDSNSKNLKMEKADILEMAVQYMKKLKEKNESKECEENCENKMIESYRLGFEKCVEETTNIIDSLPGVDNRMKDKINSHLKACLDNVRNHMAKYLYCKKLKAEEEKLCHTHLSEISQNRMDKENSTVMVQGVKDFQLIPSKILNGDIILIISPNSKENHVIKRDVWRPWW